MQHSISRRDFLAGLAALAVGTTLALPRHAFASDSTAADGSIVILHTNDVHCAVGETSDSGTTPLAYSALAAYAETCRASAGQQHVTLVDAGDAVQGKVMGTLTKGQAIIDIMNAVGYDYAIPGNHEFDFGMAQFNHLTNSATARYLSCNFMDLRSGEPTLMFSPYEIQAYDMPEGGQVSVAYVGVTTPETLSASTPRSFWRSDDDHTRVYGFCEDETGDALVQATQKAVDDARTAGADYVVLLAHLGQTGAPTRWRSDELVSRCRGIDVVLDGHSHEEYVQVIQDADGNDVIISQTGTQFSSVGQVIIDPLGGGITASTPHYEATLLREQRKDGDPAYVAAATFGRSEAVQVVVDEKAAEVRQQTGAIVGQSEVGLYAFEDDGHTWAVRAHETNLGDFVADAYLQWAWNNGVDADVALTNGGGVRSDLRAGDITRAALIDVNPFNNQLCYTQVLGQDLLDALEMAASWLPEPSGSFLQVSDGLKFAIRTDIPSPALSTESFEGFDPALERRVRRVTLFDQPIDPARTYTIVSHSYYLVDGGGGVYPMLTKNPVTLMGLDNEALMEYVRRDLNGVIGQQYADPAGQGRITLQTGPDPDPQPGTGQTPGGTADPTTPPAATDSKTEKGTPSATGPLPQTGDDLAGGAAVAAAGASLIAAAALVGSGD